MDVEWALRMIAAYPGPDRLVQAAIYDGRRYVCARDDDPKGGRAKVSGGTQYAYDNWWSTEANPGIIGLKHRYYAGQVPTPMNQHDFICRVFLGPYGYIGEWIEGDDEGFEDGHYWVGETATDGIEVWIGASAPTTTGYALYNVTEGTWEDATPSGLERAYGMCVSEEYLWIAGRDTSGDAVLMRYDGADWLTAWTGEGPEVTAIFDMQGLLYGLTAVGCWHFVSWAWEESDPEHGGESGIELDNWPLWMEAADERVWTPAGTSVAVQGAQAYGLAAFGGKAWVLQDARLMGLSGLQGAPHEELAWLDGVEARGLVKWPEEHAELDNLVVWQNRLWACGCLGEAPRVLRYGGGQAAFVEAGIWKLDRGTSGDPLIGIGRYLPGMGQVVLESCSDVMLYEMAHEWSDGDGETPRLDGMRHEWSKGEDHEPSLEALTHEFATGAGETPTLDAMTHEHSEGSGDTPTLDEFAHEWIDEELTGAETVLLDEFLHEWADELPGPEPGELIRFYVADGATDVVELRIVIEETLSEDWRAIVRVGQGAVAVNEWDSYEEAPLGANFAPTQVGTLWRVGIIGPWAVERNPGVRIDVRRA